ncbi:hypothetical protein [Treponema primitia]|uniref:hypothetical protein n=1 Tax=Treponema primitia TaxID=88058 RepID=UPI0002554E45|nr:hypothetical protein [Treponema primitia]
MFSKKNAIEAGKQGTFSVGSARETENLQWVKYKNQKTGHGFSAEDANALDDRLRGKKVDKIGLSNKKDGADRIVTDRQGNTQYIQTKYYDTAENTVNAVFDKETGQFRYKGQVVEVPKDQYEEAIKEMAKKIREGKVPGSNPHDAENEAKRLIKQGDVTYQQARNIARAGNIDSLLFDIKTQSITAGCAFGISFVIQYASCVWNGMSQKDALKLSATAGLKSGGIILGVGVLTQQFLRTTMGRSFAVFTSSISKRIIDQLYKSEIGKKIIHKLATAILGKQLAGAAAKNAVIKLLRTNLVTSTVTTVVMTMPDFYKALISKKISWKQFIKNLTVNITGVASGALGAWSGAIVGAALGSTIPIIGNVAGGIIGGILGGIGIGVGSAIGAKKLFDLISEDDAKIMFLLAQDSIVELATDYMITEDEFENKIASKISDTITPKWLEQMYQSGCGYCNKRVIQSQFAYKKLEPIFATAILNREKIIIPNVGKIRKIFRKTYLVYFLEYIKNKIRIFFGKKNVLAV